MKRTAIASLAALAGLTLSSAALTEQGKTCSSSSAAAASWTGTKNVVETALAAGNFKTLAAALGAADLVEALQAEGPFTVFAPTDEAFAKLPPATLKSLLLPENRALLTTILTYHVVPGNVRAADVMQLDNATALNGQRLAIGKSDGGVTVAGAAVVKTDIVCSNGIIHVVDEVMMPATKNIVETALGAGSFGTLAAALKAAELVAALQGEGPFTVFAPTDAAFAALPAGTVESLLKPENKEKLTAILAFHVVPGRVYADQLGQVKLETLQGRTLTVKTGAAGTTVGTAKVGTADIETTNGLIHVIEGVLIPE